LGLRISSFDYRQRLLSETTGIAVIPQPIFSLTIPQLYEGIEMEEQSTTRLSLFVQLLITSYYQTNHPQPALFQFVSSNFPVPSHQPLWGTELSQEGIVSLFILAECNLVAIASRKVGGHHTPRKTPKHPITNEMALLGVIHAGMPLQSSSKIDKPLRLLLAFSWGT